MPKKKPIKKKTVYPLTSKQERFCKECAKGINQSDSYRNAYSTKNMKPATIHRNAKAMMDNTKIATRIKQLMAPAIKKFELTAEYVLGNIIEIGKKCMEEDNKEAGALKAQELLGKHLKLFTDKVDLGGQEDNPVKEVIDVKGMDPKKLMEIIRGKTGV